jgi:hypothetical protein
MAVVAPRRWWLPAVSGDYLVTRAGDRPTLRGWSPLPAIFARPALEHALTTTAASIVFDLYAAVGGPSRFGLGTAASLDQRREITRRLDEAFRAGTLIAYRRNPPLINHIKKEDPKPPEPIPDDPKKEDPESYVNIRLVGEDGNGIPGERYRIVLPDGTSREGRLDSGGSATVRGRFAGQCKVTFPDLDAAAWESA